jgi:hypothetical protein
MSRHFNNLTPAEAERLAYLIEEMTEAQKAACKILRHGYESYNPDDPVHAGNREDLQRELRDVAGAIAKMQRAGDVVSDILESADPDKGARYMHHQD